ncbi:39S ribosomal protein L41, mitochondrial-like [Mytilus californianus]|uniref:39S ribosomal protein L41, mitochondrial-like n=1 Tax=Mytilus californianus TaxID=6549 RepID=UPI0022476F8F|nr:39S ribosomal protein L41, mitochondrial-like [Mytilus californianus]
MRKMILKVFARNCTLISSRNFSSGGCLCSYRRKQDLQPFDPKFPITGKHVNETRKGGSKIMAEKLALHVVQPTGYVDRKTYRFKNKKEMIPEFIVPDLTDFKLGPYVPYKSPSIESEASTPEQLFEALYVDKVLEEFKEGKITADMDLEDIEKLESLKRS